MPTTIENARRNKILGAVFAVLLAGALFFALRQYQRTRADTSRTHVKKQLILAVDGVSWDAFQEAQKRGLFKRFRFSSRHVAPYPSMSHPSWTEIIGTRRVFGNRGNAHTIESRWFDLEDMRIADDPRQVFARQVSPYNYQRAFDYFFNPLIEPLMYLRGEKVFNRELEEAESAILTEFTGDRYVAYYAGPDAMGHTHLNGLWNYLTRLDSSINRVVDTLSARGEAPDVWMVSDHGNAPGFVEGSAEKYLQTFSLDNAIRKAGLSRADTGRLIRDDQVAVVTIALATMVNVYFADLEKRRGLAEAALKAPAVDLATWLEVRGSDKYVVVLGPNNSEARVRWRSGSYAYESINGNPLGLPDSLVSKSGERQWIGDAEARNSSIDAKYPDALFRIVQSAVKQVENAPDLIINLRDGYCYKGDLGQFVRMVRTHGSLSARSSTGILASTAKALPPMVRGEEILGIIGVTPQQMLWRVAALDGPISGAPSGNGWLNTGRQDESRQTSFLRRARIISASMDYFAYDVMRVLFNDIRAKTSSKSNSSSVNATKNAIKRADIVGGVKNNVDTLLSLLDSIDIKAVPDRVKKAESRARQIPELSSLGDIRSAWKQGDSAYGSGASVRRAAMAMWTIPYFLDDILSAPEEDSIPDPRDASFAKNWNTAVRASIARDPARLLRDSTLAPKLFDQVFAERKAIRTVQPAVFPLLYNPNLDGVTVVYVPGIYGELFDAEIWSRGVKSIRDRLGVRILSLHIDGRCSSELNAGEIVNALRADTKRRVDRGYARPNYMILGYSKGGIDATRALLLAPDVAPQVSALVTLATPHKGSPVAERSDVPKEVMQWAVSAQPKPACDTAGASHSLWASTRASFWSLHAKEVASSTRNFSVSFVSDMASAHPWMKITKRIGEFSEPNDGVVGLSSSRFPDNVHAVNLGTITGDHISGRLASSFPQDAFLEAVVITVAELGALDTGGRREWMSAVNELRATSSGRGGHANGHVIPFPSSLRAQQPLPGGSTGWKPDATFSATRPIDPGGRVIRMLTPAADPTGFAFKCDQSSMLAFRREYEFYYDSSNGGSEDELANGFAIVPFAESAGGRACHLASTGTAIKMTTASFQYRPVDFPQLGMRFKVVKDLTGVDAGKLRKGKNDAAFKLWLVLEDTRPGSGNKRYMFGYWWPGRDASGHFAPGDSLVEALSSRRNLVFSTLPEAWLITIGAQNQVGKWQSVQRNLAADVHRAFPGIPASALKVVGITLQSDSDETRGTTEVYFESMTVSRSKNKQ